MIIPEGDEEPELKCKYYMRSSQPEVEDVIEYTFRNVVENARSGELRPYATSSDVSAGDLVMLISGRHLGPHLCVEAHPDDDPIRAVLEVGRIEEGPKPYKYFVHWSRVVLGESTPRYLAEVAFDDDGHPRYDRFIAIHKQIEEATERLLVVDLEDGTIMTANLARITRS